MGKNAEITVRKIENGFMVELLLRPDPAPCYLEVYLPSLESVASCMQNYYQLEEGKALEFIIAESQKIPNGAKSAKQ